MITMEQITYPAKSAIIGRKAKISDDKKERPCFISLFPKNNPHKTGEVPEKIIDVVTHKIIFKGLQVEYLIEGNDILINNLESISVEQNDMGHVTITGTQSE